jgi:type I restriction enzyme M protein
VDWKAQQKEILKEHETLGFKGRFGAGLPRVNDGSLLFLQHMIAKFEEVAPDRQKYGTRIAIVLNGSPLFTGGAGSGESEIRKWIIENDWLEAIVALPEQMFYNTGIGTYVWIVTNRKEKRRKGKIQLIDARERWKPMRRSLGDKRRELGDDDIDAIVREHGKLKDSETCKTFDNADFGYTRVTVERPLRLAFEITSAKLDSLKAGKTEIAKLDDLAPKVRAEIVTALTEANDGKCWSNREKFREFLAATLPDCKRPLREWVLMLMAFKHSKADVCVDGDGKPEPDRELRDYENVPLKEDVEAYFKREVLPHVPDAWMDRSKDKVGCEINFNRHFYRYTPPRELAAIDADLKLAEEKILGLLKEVTE